MSEHIWHDAKNPPDNARIVMLRFDDDGSRDCRGFYGRSHGEGYAKSWKAYCDRGFVHPVKWREIGNA